MLIFVTSAVQGRERQQVMTRDILGLREQFRLEVAPSFVCSLEMRRVAVRVWKDACNPNSISIYLRAKRVRERLKGVLRRRELPGSGNNRCVRKPPIWPRQSHHC